MIIKKGGKKVCLSFPHAKLLKLDLIAFRFLQKQKQILAQQQKRAIKCNNISGLLKKQTNKKHQKQNQKQKQNKNQTKNIYTHTKKEKQPHSILQGFTGGC